MMPALHSVDRPKDQRHPWTLDPECHYCGSTLGYYFKKNDQNTLWCARCETYQNRNVPKRSTGEVTRPISMRTGIKPSTKARIMARDNYRCCGCGKGPPTILHIGHLLSVADAEILKSEGLPVTDADLNSDHNLFTACEECNVGQGGRSYWLRTAYFILRANSRA